MKTWNQTPNLKEKASKGFVEIKVRILVPKGVNGRPKRERNVDVL